MVDSQMREERANLGFSHLVRVAFTVKEVELLNPMPVSLFGSEAVVFKTNDVAELIDEFGWFMGRLALVYPRTQPVKCRYT